MYKGDDIMEIIIHGDKIKVTDAMKDYVKEKLQKLDKYLENSDNVRANVIVKVKNYTQRVEITIPLKTFILRSEEQQEDFYAAVDKTIDKLERQIRKNKTKMMSKHVKTSQDFNFASFEPEDEDDEAESHENPYADGHDTLVPILHPIPYSFYDLHISSSSGFPSARS